MLQNVIVFVHGLLCFAIVALVLLQRGKGADAGAGFGAGASGTVFGARGSATFFSKLTAVLATLFFMTSLSLAWFATRPQARAPAPEATVPVPDESIGADTLPTLPPSTTPAAEPPAEPPAPAQE